MAAHYLQQVVVIVRAGRADRRRGRRLARRAVTGLYADFFHFPSVPFVMPPWVVLVGRWRDARRRRSPARSARCDAVVPRAGRGHAPAGPAHLPAHAAGAARPRRAAVAGDAHGRSATWSGARCARCSRPLGIAAAVAIVISGLFWGDAIDYMIDVQFNAAQRGDARSRWSSRSTRGRGREIARLPGVLPPRMRARAGRAWSRAPPLPHRDPRATARRRTLRRLLDADRNRIPFRPDGHPAHRPPGRAARRRVRATCCGSRR